MRLRELLVLASIAALAANSVHAANDAAPDTRDRQVLSVAVADFIGWEGATFGKLKGSFGVRVTTTADSNPSASSMRIECPRQTTGVDSPLVTAYFERNQKSVPVERLIHGLPFLELYSPPAGVQAGPSMPTRFKAVGSVTLPGYSADGTRALLTLRHSWSVHAAVITYVLRKQGARWGVLCRNQTVQF